MILPIQDSIINEWVVHRGSTGSVDPKYLIARNKFSDLVNNDELIPMSKIKLKTIAVNNRAINNFAMVIHKVMFPDSGSISRRYNSPQLSQLQSARNNMITELREICGDDRYVLSVISILHALFIGYQGNKNQFLELIARVREEVSNGQELQRVKETLLRDHPSIDDEYSLLTLNRPTNQPLSRLFANVFSGTIKHKTTTDNRVVSGKGVILCTINGEVKNSIIVYVKKEFLEAFEYNYNVFGIIDPTHIVVYMDENFDVVRSDYGSLRKHYRKELFKMLRDNNVEIVRSDLTSRMAKPIGVPNNLTQRRDFDKNILSSLRASMLLNTTRNMSLFKTIMSETNNSNRR